MDLKIHLATECTGLPTLSQRRFCLSFCEKTEPHQVFESNEIDLNEEINELSVYELTNLLVEIKENQITLSSQDTPFRLTKRGERLMINRRLELFYVLISDVAEKRAICTSEGLANLGRIYDEKYPVQWEAYCEAKEKEMNSLFNSWTLNGSALNLRFFNLYTRPCTIILHNMKNTSIQLGNTSSYLAAGSTLEIRKTEIDCVRFGNSVF